MYIMVTKKTLSFAHEALMCLLMFYFLSAVVVMNEQLKLDLRDLTKREKQTHKHHHHVTITQLDNMAKQHSKEVSNNSNNVRIQVPDPDIWQTVVPKKLFAYSSYLDTRHSKEDGINILVIVHLDYKTPLYCQIWHHHNGDPLLVSGTMEKFPEQFTYVAKKNLSFCACACACARESGCLRFELRFNIPMVINEFVVIKMTNLLTFTGKHK